MREKRSQRVFTAAGVGMISTFMILPVTLGKAKPVLALSGAGTASTGVDSSSASAASPESPASLSPKILRAVQEILNTVKESKYTHTSHVVEASGVYDVDCSGLVDLVLKRVSPPHLAEVEKLSSHKVQKAEDYYETFNSSHAAGWQHLVKVADLTPGDIVCWKLPPGSKNTGHVLIVAAAPVLLTNQPDQAKNPGAARVYSLAIIDSTESPHGDDSRTAGQTGVGHGTIYVVADDADKPIGIHWSAKMDPMKPEKMAMGRAVGK